MKDIHLLHWISFIKLTATNSSSIYHFLLVKASAILPSSFLKVVVHPYCIITYSAIVHHNFLPHISHCDLTPFVEICCSCICP